MKNPVGGEFLITRQPESETARDNAAATHTIKCGRSGERRSGSLRRRCAIERAVDSMRVVIASEFIELARQVCGVPEE